VNSLAKARDIVRASFLTALRPDPMLTVSQWSDKYRRLSQKASAEPGIWKTDRTPYLREIMDALSPMSPIEEVVFMKGAQVGGTEAGNNWIGFVIDYAPAPMMIVQPTVDLAKRNSKLRIAPLIDESPRVREKVKEARARDSGNTVLSKEFNGGVLLMVGANSAVGLRSAPIKFLMLDEVDAYPGDVDGEGDPVTLAEARTRTFSRRKKYKVSTPTFEGRSRIQKDYLESDMRRYHVPCPHCDHFQWLKWAQVKWPENQPHNAYYACESCEKPIPEHCKTVMLKRGRWIAERPGAKNGKVAGFHLSALYSPLGWFSWGEAAQLFLECKGNAEKLRGFVNTVLGECWVEKGDAPEWEKLFHMRESYPIGVVPPGGAFLTAGVDIQKDRIEYEVVAWGRGKESWSVTYEVIYGDTATEAPWLELDKLVGKEFPTAAGAYMGLRAIGVDTGFQTQAVYDWVRKHPPTKVFAVKGQDGIPTAVGTAKLIDINIKGRKIKRGIRLWPVGSSVIKSEIYAYLRLERPTDPSTPFPAGFCHFPEYGEEFFKMLTAEQIEVRIVKGYRKFLWAKIRDRNEALDTRVYARAAAAIVGLDRFTEKDWSAMGAPPAKRTEQAKPDEAKPREAAPAKPQNARSPQRRKSSFL
jgi:phage terminase large subunit GpA-like protein